MRSDILRLVDFSGGTDFEDALASTRAVVRAIAALGYYSSDDGTWADAEPAAHMEVLGTGDREVLAAVLAAPATVLHIASHTTGRGDAELGFHGRGDEFMPVSELAEMLAKMGRGIRAPCVLVDGCNAGTNKFLHAFSNCLAAPTIAVASRRMISEGDSVVFAANFYGALLQRRGKGSDALDRVEKAASQAAVAFQHSLGRVSPYRATRLQPSRKAARCFG